MPNNSLWLRWAPGILAVQDYQPSCLVRDLVGGDVPATILEAPAVVVYVLASGLPGIVGLYATIVLLIASVPFDPSRILVLDPDSSLAVLILGVVSPIAADPAHALGPTMGQINAVSVARS